MLNVAGLCLRYPQQDLPLLRDVSFSLGPGALLWLRGPNGSGKTSLLNLISGIIPQRVKAECSGTVTLSGTDLCALPLNEKFRHLAYQMSDPDHQIFFPRISKELSFALENAGLPAAEMQQRMAAASASFGLEQFGKVEPGLLSQGQKKMLALASCAALDPPLYLLDEPTSALSDSALQRLLAWLRKILDAGRIVIVAEHNAILESLATLKLDLPK
ncbi:MAG: energy-coupling factor ABC transporter ATP-binding protein [Candidatus Cloacimonetes bacterium]|nr:energy-coupling factor ABC transporter ATP-binding protein [Candidatus Cloacimonadota bacterium]